MTADADLSRIENDIISQYQSAFLLVFCDVLCASFWVNNYVRSSPDCPTEKQGIVRSTR